MHEEEDGSIRAELPQPFQAVPIVLQVLGHLPTLDVEHVYQDPYVLEDGCTLGSEVAVHEGILPAAIPEVENEVAEETNMVLLDVDGSSETCSRRCGVIGAEGWLNILARLAGHG